MPPETNDADLTAVGPFDIQHLLLLSVNSGAVDDHVALLGLEFEADGIDQAALCLFRLTLSSSDLLRGACRAASCDIRRRNYHHPHAPGRIVACANGEGEARPCHLR